VFIMSHYGSINSQAEKEPTVSMAHNRRTWLSGPVALLALALFGPTPVQAACCYFSAKDQDVLQPAQKVFITFDPVKGTETFTVQPEFEGNALDFGMVIPPPSQPKLHTMPRDFFKHLAVYSILMKREFPHSKLLPQEEYQGKLLKLANLNRAEALVTAK